MQTAGKPSWKIMVLAGGPDREHDVSLKSGASIAAALTQAGHNPVICDLTPDHTEAIERFNAEGFDAIFPALHGPWGEGGGMQTLLEQHRLPYVGCQPEAARRAMDKAVAKALFTEANLLTPNAQVIERGHAPENIPTPCVVKPVDEGSSIHLAVCHDTPEIKSALAIAFEHHARMLVEQFVAGREFTVGVLGTGDAAQALPPIEIRPADGQYDYEAKYLRDDTDYLFNTAPPEAATGLQDAATTAHRVLGCRDLSRSDFMLGQDGKLYLLETNTLPGFTDHSLLPKAAAESGMPLPALCHQLVAWAMGRQAAQ